MTTKPRPVAQPDPNKCKHRNVYDETIRNDEADWEVWHCKKCGQITHKKTFFPIELPRPKFQDPEPKKPN